MNEAHCINLSLRLAPETSYNRHRRPLPPATIELLIALQILLVQVRDLLGMLDRAVARCFGSAQAGFVLTNLTRGILRAIALERVLLAPAGGQPAVDQTATANRKARTQTSPDTRSSASRQHRASRDRLPALPTLRQLEAAIRGRPIETVIADISHDLGVSFSLCEARFSNTLRDMLAGYRGMLANILHEAPRHAAAFAAVPECNDAFALPPQKPGAIRYTVGLLFGAQQPVCGFPSTASPSGAATAGAHPP